MSGAKGELAIFGGPKAVESDAKDMFTGPIIGEEGAATLL